MKLYFRGTNFTKIKMTFQFTTEVIGTGPRRRVRALCRGASVSEKVHRWVLFSLKAIVKMWWVWGWFVFFFFFWF